MIQSQSSKIFIFALSLLMPALTSAAPVVTRDQYGMPIIKGGTQDEIFYEGGYAYATDRLWQIYGGILQATGRQAEFFGSDFIQSDIFQRSINYTDQELLDQFNAAKPEAQAVYQALLQGYNDRIDELNAMLPDTSLIPLEFLSLGIVPIPNITLPELLALTRNIYSGIVGYNLGVAAQLDNLAMVGTIAAVGGVDDFTAFNIFNDLRPSTKALLTVDTMVPNDDCGNPGENPCSCRKPSTYYHARSGAAINRNEVATAGKIAHQVREARKQSETMNCLPKVGSYGAAVSGRRNKTGNQLFLEAPQSGYNWPDTFYLVLIESEQADVAAFYSQWPFLIDGTIHDVSLGVQSGGIGINDTLVEPATNKILPGRPELIQVAGAPGVPIEVFRSTSGGFVFVNNNGEGQQITLRTPFIGKDLTPLLNYTVNLIHVHNIPELIKMQESIENLTPLTSYHTLAVDSCGNIAALYPGVSTTLPDNIDRRFSLGSVINPEIDVEYTIQPPLVDVNTERGFYTGWNNLYKQQLDYPYINLTYGPGLSGALSLTRYLNEREKVTFEDMISLYLDATNQNLFLGSKTSDLTGGRDIWFASNFRESFFAAVEAAGLNPDRAAAVALLADYNGLFIDGDLDAIANGFDVSDKWILANLWVKCVIEELTNPYLQGTNYAFPPSTPGSLATLFPNTQGFLGIDGPNFANLLSRLLGTDCDNTLFFDGWPQGQELDDIIVASLDRSLELLGGIPFNPSLDGQRVNFLYTLGIGLPVGTSIPWRNAGSIGSFVEHSKCGAIRNKFFQPNGQNGTILVGEEGLIYLPHSFDQAPLFQEYTPRTIQVFESVQAKLNSCKRCCSTCKPLTYAPDSQLDLAELQEVFAE